MAKDDKRTEGTGVWWREFFAVPSPTDIASRRFDNAGRRRASWTVEEQAPNVRVSDVVEKYGQRFVWSSLHKTHSALQPLRDVGDPDCDAVLAELDPQPDDDILQRLLDRADAASSAGSTDPGDKILCDFVRRYTAEPDWVDWSEIRRGQRVFVRNLPICGLTLFYLSLVGGFSAPLITKVLRATGYLTSAPKRVMRRLADTGHMICECLVPGSLRPEVRGEGWKAVLRVRFLHGMVRRRLHDKPYWKPELWGVPVNQEDMMATLLAFSYNVLVGSEMVLGRPLSDEDQHAYMHLWRFIGWLMGVEEENNPCVDVPHGKAALESIVMHLLEPDRDSIAVAHHLLQAPSRGARSLRFRHELCRRFLGRDLADALELKRDTTMEGLVTVFLWILRAYGWAAHSRVGAYLETLHTWALDHALSRGHRMGSTHQLRADLPSQYSDKTALSTDSLPTPSPLSACPFLALSSALAQNGAEGGGENGEGGRFLGESAHAEKLDKDAAVIPGYVYVDSGVVRGAMLVSGLSMSALGVAWAIARFKA